MNLFKLIIIIVFFSSILNSCSNKVIKRNSYGYRSEGAPAVIGAKAVKKKIVLLSFFNESPFGGNDLGVTATEEFRKEISRGGQFLIDPMSKKLFGDSSTT